MKPMTQEQVEAELLDISQNFSHSGQPYTDLEGWEFYEWCVDRWCAVCRAAELLGHIRPPDVVSARQVAGEQDPTP